MALYLLTVASFVITAWAAMVLLIGRFLVRPRTRRRTPPPPTRPTPKRRDDFTLVA